VRGAWATREKKGSPPVGHKAGVTAESGGARRDHGVHAWSHTTPSAASATDEELKTRGTVGPKKQKVILAFHNP